MEELPISTGGDFFNSSIDFNYRDKKILYGGNKIQKLNITKENQTKNRNDNRQ